MRIECNSCEMYLTSHCEDCLVTALLSPEDEAIDIDDELDPSIQALAAGGLIPVLKFRPRTEPAAEKDPESKDLSDTG